METYRGRLIHHVQLRVADLDASVRFYEATLGALGIDLVRGPGYAVADELWISPSKRVSFTHVSFQAPDRDAVDRFREAALAAGGRSTGAPDAREFPASYYAAWMLDPDGNNVDAVYEGPRERSAPSVRITW